MMWADNWSDRWKYGFKKRAFTVVEIYWDGKIQDGERVASGVYFYSLELGGESQTRRMVTLK